MDSYFSKPGDDAPAPTSAAAPVAKKEAFLGQPL
jgi:hypothetical protein